jgi:hypothetical protein
VDVAGGGAVAGSAQTPAPEPVDLAHEVVEQILASVQLRASARVFATAADLRGSLVDLLA